MKKIFVLFNLCFIAFHGMSQSNNPYWTALGMLESNNSDSVRGRDGEVSRYQIMPAIWFQYCKSATWKNPTIACGVASKIMALRVKAFSDKFHNAPSPMQWALLWHCPARATNPTAEEMDYAMRFNNLLTRFTKEQNTKNK